MKKKKIRVGLLFGGKSAEHEVSLQSAKNVADAIDKNTYEVVLIGINKSGQWLFNQSPRFLLNTNDPKRIALNPVASQSVALVPQSTGSLSFLGTGPRGCCGRCRVSDFARPARRGRHSAGSAQARERAVRRRRRFGLCGRDG